MDVHNINTALITIDCPEDATADQIRFEGAKTIFESDVLPLMLQYDNVSLIGAYEDSEKLKKKYVLDIGYEHLALGFMITIGNSTIIAPIVCKKDDVNSVDCLYDANSTNTSIICTVDTNKKTVSISLYKLRVISKDNKLKVFLGCLANNNYSYYVALDVDSFGNKYLVANGYNNIYYDKSDYTKYSYHTTISFRSIDDESYVFKSQLPIYQSNILYGISRDLVLLFNPSTNAGSNLKIIDVENTKYRQLGSELWYVDN